MSVIDAHVLSLDCPRCAGRFQATIGRLRADFAGPCPHCGSTLQLDTDELDIVARRVERQLRDVERSVGRRLKVVVDLGTGGPPVHR